MKPSNISRPASPPTTDESPPTQPVSPSACSSPPSVAATQPQQYPTLRPKPAQPSDNSSVTAELQRLLRNGIHMLNDRALTFEGPAGAELLAHSAPDCTGQLDNYPGLMRLDQVFAIARTWEVLAPNARFAVISSDANVTTSTAASAWVEVEVSGLVGEGGPLRVRAFVETSWRRETDGRWLMRGFHAMRALPYGLDSVTPEPLD